ncbi:branched-chain amino acid ABC transporter substrate-binding protein [Burkholderia plantarii]|uniref:branched-chain amino acid ABC transporter substrate-binding protein n=1 Tax=Burkholderia plantarii TaxID=41899 RepID=UPI0018DCFF7E|nr:branched-chain amino acid ABC transporter substrate-binding protein [Burkholderia plantarii]MBI0331377.1 branched-chain amino acid ABC transporter substrate-binding protein [Burkholderia plantarii]
MKIRSRFARRIVLTAVLACAAGDALAQEVVKIGVASPLTGSAAAYGKDIEDGVRMAVDEANATHPVIGGKPVRFEVDSQDDQGDPRVGVQVAQQLADDHVAAVIGHFNSGTTLPASKIYAKAGIPMLTPAATNPDITRAGLATVYRVIANDVQNAGNAGAYAATVTRAKRIAIIDDRTAFGQGEADQFEKAVRANGGTVVAHEFVSDKTVDFSAQLTRIKSANADLVFFGGLDAQAAMLVKRMRQLGMRAQFLAGGGVMNANFIRLAGPAAEGASVWEYGQPLARLAKGRQFEAQFRGKYGVDMLAYAPFAYDATWIVIHAMQQAGTVAPAGYNATLKATRYDGITGTIAFMPNGDLKQPSSTLYQVKSLAWVPVTTRQGAE